MERNADDGGNNKSRASDRFLPGLQAVQSGKVLAYVGIDVVVAVSGEMGGKVEAMDNLAAGKTDDMLEEGVYPDAKVFKVVFLRGVRSDNVVAFRNVVVVGVDRQQRR